MSQRYDLVVIGAGSAGLSAVSFALRLGMRVALVERDRVGGDCTWTGCVPSKALVHAAAVAHTVRHAREFGVPVTGSHVDFPAVMAGVRAAIERVYAHETPAVLRAHGADVLHGEARFLNSHVLSVDGVRLTARRFVIATGADPVRPNISGLGVVPYLTYQNLFALTDLPRTLLVVGGGSIGVEMSQALQRLGAQVTLLHRGERILPVADAEASSVLHSALQREGVDVRTRSPVEEVTAAGGAVRAIVRGQPVEGDALLVATGRRPRLRGLDLERAGVGASERGVEVDETLRTSARHIYAAGDVTGSYQYTHYAGWQGFLAARNALLPGTMRAARNSVPWAVFTDPEIAQAGLTEEQAREGGEKIRVYRRPAERIDRAQTLGETEGFLKLIVRPDGTLLGAVVVGGAASEVANELAVALEQGLKLSQLARSIHIYPTYGIAIQQAASEAVTAGTLRGWRGRTLRALAKWLP